MAKLTQRALCLTEDFRSDCGKRELVRKLGNIEYHAASLLDDVCAYHCRFSKKKDRDELEVICAACPVTQLMALIE